MGSFKTEAEDYEPKGLKNISELKSIDVDIALTTETRQDAQDKDYIVTYFIVDDEEYRVPISVLAQLKEVIAEKPELKTFKVKKTGQDLKTKYQVIPLE